MKKLLLVPFLVSLAFGQYSAIDANNPNVYNQQMNRLFSNWQAIRDEPSIDVNSVATIYKTSQYGGDVDATAVAMKAATDNGTLYINSPNGTAVMSTGVTLTATEKLANDPNCYITGTGSPTLTNNGYLDATGRIFDITTMSHAGGGLYPHFEPEWYGAVADDGISDSAAIQAANDDANDLGGGTVKGGEGRYYITTPIEPSSCVTFEGIGGSEATNFHADDNCFEYNDPGPGGGTYVSIRKSKFKNLLITGASGNTGYAFFTDPNQNLIDFGLDNVKTNSEIGGIKIDAASAITGLYASECIFTASSAYGFFCETGGELNSLLFDKCWFTANALGAFKAGSATGYAVFDGCVFESNQSQYTVDLANAQATFIGCIWSTNGDNSASPISNGADLYIRSGNQSHIRVDSCNFGKPDADVVSWTNIIDAQASSQLSVTNCFADCTDSNTLAFYDFLSATSGICQAEFKNNRFSGGETKELIPKDVLSSMRVVGNLGDYPYTFDVPDIMVSVETTDATVTTVWGGTFLGPFLEYPDANSTVAYEATVVARSTDANDVYMFREQWGFYEVEETSADVYTITSRGSGSTDNAKKGTLTSSFSVVNNGAQTAGVRFTVTGVAATTIRWSVRIKALGARVPSTF